MIAFDDIQDGAFTIPSLTTAPHRHQIATNALQSLADRVYPPARLPARQVIAAHQLVVRESTGG